MTPPAGAGEVVQLRQKLEVFAERFAERAEAHRVWDDPAQGAALRANTLALCRSLLEDWTTIALQYQQSNTRLKYQQYEPVAGKQLLYEPLHPELSTLRPEQRRFGANRSMRDVETEVELAIKKLNDWGSRP